MHIQVESATRYVDGPTKRRLVNLGFRATGKTRRVYEMRHDIVLIELATAAAVETFLQREGATWDGWGPIQLGREAHS